MIRIAKGLNLNCSSSTFISFGLQKHAEHNSGGVHRGGALYLIDADVEVSQLSRPLRSPLPQQ